MGKLSKRFFASVRLGDKIEVVASALGVKPCDGCRRRKAWLNGEQLTNTPSVYGNSVPSGNDNSRQG